MTVALPRYQLFPSLSIEEAAALRKDIADRGVMVPVELDESGAILDGHHRVQIAGELGIEYPTVVRSGMTEAEKLEHVFALNYARRSLSKVDRQVVIAECRQRRMSLRAIAALVGASKSTVARVPFGTPEVHHYQEPEPEYREPLPPPVTRAEKAAELASGGLSHRAIADELQVDPATVATLLDPGGAPATRDTPAEWANTKALLDAIKELPTRVTDPRVIAQSVPERNRASAARTLRRVGTLLGSIALELERSDR
jgi:ParB-like chromosome segregation protein Spo0J